MRRVNVESSVSRKKLLLLRQQGFFTDDFICFLEDDLEMLVIFAGVPVSSPSETMLCEQFVA